MCVCDVAQQREKHSFCSLIELICKQFGFKGSLNQTSLFGIKFVCVEFLLMAFEGKTCVRILIIFIVLVKLCNGIHVIDASNQVSRIRVSSVVENVINVYGANFPPPKNMTFLEPHIDV